MGRKPPIPLTLVVGPTGAGKTTLVNRLIRDPAFADTAVILNDFGTVALETSLVDSVEDDILALGGGCVCCSVRGALTDGLERLLRALDNGRIARIGRVVIEAAETADPAAVVAAIVAHPYLSLRFVVDGIVAVPGADAAATLKTRADVAGQVAIADVVALRAADIGIALPNVAAAVLDAEGAPPVSFAGHGPFDPETGDIETWLVPRQRDRATGDADVAARISSFAVQRAATLSPAEFERFLQYVVILRGYSIVRLKAAGTVGATDIMVAESYGAFFLPPLMIERENAATFGIRFVVAARNFDEAAFARYLDAFLNQARIDTPDRQALIENPLAVAGFSARETG
jgi:G3E family GTPase